MFRWIILSALLFHSWRCCTALSPTRVAEFQVHDVPIVCRQRNFEGTVRGSGPTRPGDGTGTTVWPAALPLSSYLVSLAASLRSELRLERPLRVLELGAGCGLLGISLAAVAGASVVLTDTPFELEDGTTTLGWLEGNIDLNQATIEANGGQAECTQLTWGNENHFDEVRQKFPSGFDLVVGSDLLYYSESYPELMQTITAFAGTSSESMETRSPEALTDLSCQQDERSSVAVLGYNIRNGAEVKFGQDSDVFSVLTKTIPGPARPGKNPTSKTISHFVFGPGHSRQLTPG